MSKKFYIFLTFVFACSVYFSAIYFHRLYLIKVDEFYSEMKTSLIFPHAEERDSALPLNNPPITQAKVANFMDPEDLVIGVNYNGMARAYPIWIMVAYHIINDNFAGKPVLVTHCEICSASGAFRPYVDSSEKMPLSFVSCEYRNGTFSLCDMQTKSRWHPFSGSSVAGVLNGNSLQSIPLKLVKWKNWVRVNPNTDVLYSDKELTKRLHGRGPSFDVGNDHISWLIGMTANLNDRRLTRSDLVFGIINSNPISPVAIKLKNVADYSLQVVRHEGDCYLLMHTVDYDYQVFNLSNYKNEKYFFNKTFDGILSDKGGVWDLSGKVDKKSLIKVNLNISNGYFTEWYEWVSNYPNTVVVKLD